VGKIRDAVEQELSFDPLLNASDITVKNINGDVAQALRRVDHCREVTSGPDDSVSGGPCVR
jgi:hypothetical protein